MHFCRLLTTMYVKTIIYIVLFIGLSNCLKKKKDGSSLKPVMKKILGGEYVNITEVPYLAALLKSGVHACGASILSEYWLITAAHCLIKNTHALSISTGTTDLTKGGQRFVVESFHVHTGYDHATSNHDIALIKLVKPIEFSEVQQPIKITKVWPKIGDKIKISGFGRTGPQRNSKYGKMSIVYATNYKTCQQAYPNHKLTSNMFCAYGEATDACAGDSGGAAVINNTVSGLVSFGRSCDRPTRDPGVYTNVYNYQAWIVEITGQAMT